MLGIQLREVSNRPCKFWFQKFPCKSVVTCINCRVIVLLREWLSTVGCWPRSSFMSDTVDPFTFVLSCSCYGKSAFIWESWRTNAIRMKVIITLWWLHVFVTLSNCVQDETNTTHLTEPRIKSYIQIYKLSFLSKRDWLHEDYKRITLIF